MAKNKTVDVGTVAFGGVVVKRWWRSLEVWNAVLGSIVASVTVLLGLAAAVAPVALTYLSELGLTPLRTMILAITLNLIIQINQIVLKVRSTSMIGNKVDVQIAKETTGDGAGPNENGVT